MKHIGIYTPESFLADEQAREAADFFGPSALYSPGRRIAVGERVDVAQEVGA